MNKIKLIILFILIIFKIQATEIETIKYFYYFDQYYNEKQISLIIYKDKIGFKIDLVYFITDKVTFQKTINENKINFKWNVYTQCHNEFLMVRQFIYVLTIDDKEINFIEFIITADWMNENMLNYIYLKFDKKYLKEFLYE